MRVVILDRAKRCKKCLVLIPVGQEAEKPGILSEKNFHYHPDCYLEEQQDRKAREEEENQKCLSEWGVWPEYKREVDNSPLACSFHHLGDWIENALVRAEGIMDGEKKGWPLAFDEAQQAYYKKLRRLNLADISEKLALLSQQIKLLNMADKTCCFCLKDLGMNLRRFEDGTASCAECATEH
jgi:hypothetical protein